MSVSPRKLPESVLKVFHQALDESDFETARALLRVAESLLGLSPSPKRLRDFVSACERLWELQHGDTE